MNAMKEHAITNRLGPFSPRCDFEISEPTDGILGLTITTAAGAGQYAALTIQEAERLHALLGIELQERSMRDSGFDPDTAYGDEQAREAYLRGEV